MLTEMSWVLAALLADPAGSCISLLAGVAGTCGLAATFTPVSVFAAWACISGFYGALCACKDYLPLKVC